ncbi:MAG: putative sulfate exporter family transporter [Candidatus Acidiferrales bacterium]
MFPAIRQQNRRQALNTKTLFFVGLILCATGIISPPIALTLGLIYGLSFVHPYQADSRNLSKFLLQASVVGLGFGMNLHEVLRAGRSGFVYTAASISFALIFGLLAGLFLRVNRTASILISTGTAICGGSAIAAIAPIIGANDEEMAVSLGTVFILNSIALLIFPPLGWALHLTQQQFGLWAALAIHDTSSVVGAASRYGPVALVIGTTVKLTRALWIVPVAIGAAVLKRSKTRIQWPWFILFFCLAAVANTYLPAFTNLWHVLSNLGKLGLTATLYLIGTGISRATLREVGWPPLLQGIILWILVGVTSLWLIFAGWISI